MSFEIRLHGRGGQGGVTCAKLLAAIHARLGKSVQAFGDYAGERSGAPVRAYTRVGDEPITNRNKVYRPDALLVLDPTLLGREVVAGLAPGGALLLNTTRSLDDVAAQFPGHRVGVVDATAIARAHGIGTRSVVIVNTTIAGAYVRMAGLPDEAMEGAFRDLGLASNLAAARQAHAALAIREPQGGLESGGDEPPPARVVVPALTEHAVSEPTGLKTGAWRTQLPRYTENLAPCNAWCPAGNDVVGFVQAVAREGDDAASTVLARTQPFASVCGRVCPAPCMEGCNRRELDGSVNIRGLERWVGDNAPIDLGTPVQAARPRRIAIVGGGPAGLSAACELARAGHRAIVLDADAALGGVLQSGIPAYRLPRDVLNREIDAILALGVEARCGEAVDRRRVDELAGEHDAVILATGLARLRGLDVEGSALDGIEQGIAFLRRVNLRGGVRLSGRVVVLGGGNTAMDCARSALRMGAESVTVAYRRTAKEMPAISEEVDEAVKEGVRFLYRRQPVAFLPGGDGARVAEVELAEIEMGEPDETGRRRPVVTDRRERLACDHVLLALGQSADLSLLPEGWEVHEGRVLRDGRELNVFAAGDLSTGDGTVTHAIGDGRRAAGRALQALGEDVEVFLRPDRTSAVPATDIRMDHFERSAPARDRSVDVTERLGGFEEANLGLPESLESHRCFSCGHCTRCDTCLVYCPEGIIRREDLGYEVDYSYCKGCGICVEECPRRAMEMVAE